MAFEIRIQSIQQVPPITANDAKLLIQFQVLGIKPDFVQVYAVNYGETTPAGLGAIADTVDMTIPDPVYASVIDVLAGAIYTIWLCGRTGTKDNPDDQIDGVYWESLCVGQTVVTKSDPLPAAQRKAPIISGIDAEPATISDPDRITVKWTSQPYDKFLIWWTQNGEALAQGEVDSSGSSGSWTASPTVPGARYTFAVKGGTYGGIFGNYNYSDWGPTISATAPRQYSSLRYFLRASGVNPGAQPLRKLAHKQSSVRKFMKLS
jgi:hypothetical protein